MMVIYSKGQEFRFGYQISGKHFEAFFGWVGLIILWKKVKDGG